jgi:hypothetical protein
VPIPNKFPIELEKYQSQTSSPWSWKSTNPKQVPHGVRKVPIPNKFPMELEKFHDEKYNFPKEQ